MPETVPHDSQLKNWWCDPSTEYAFVGFSYEVTACEYGEFYVEMLIWNVNVHVKGQSPAQLKKEFSDIRHHFNSRYVRLYGACDREGF